VNKVFKNPTKISLVEFVMISPMVAVNKDQMGVGSAGSANGKAQLAPAMEICARMCVMRMSICG